MFEEGLRLGLLCPEDQSKYAFVAPALAGIGRIAGKSLGGAFRFAKNNPMTALTASFAVPGAVSAGKRVTKSMGSGVGNANPARKNLLDPVTSKGPMGSIF